MQQTLTPAPARSVPLPLRVEPVGFVEHCSDAVCPRGLAMFARLALGYRKIRKLRRTGRAIASPVWKEIVASHRTDGGLPVLLESEAVQVPMTVGFVRPAVILPADWQTWDDWKLRAVLLHEIAHVRRCDWAIAAIAATSKCAYWLNPLSWFLERQLSQLAEQASDDASLLSHTEPNAICGDTFGIRGGRTKRRPTYEGRSRDGTTQYKARIERVLGNPQSGTGIVKIAGWILVMMSAAPVIYSAAALQVASEPLKAPGLHTLRSSGGILRHRHRPLAPGSASVSSGYRSPSSAEFPDSSCGPADLVSAYGSRKSEIAAKPYTDRTNLQKLQKYNESIAGPVSGVPQYHPINLRRLAFLQEEMYRAQLRMLQTEVAIGES